MSSDPRANNFNVIRFAAALLVLLSHSFQISYGNYHREAVWLFSRHQTTLGTLCVVVFFVVSGHLITASYTRHPDPVRFVQARALRLMPGLAASLALTALLLGPALTTAGLLDYIANPATLRFFLENLFLTSNAGGLPGVFASNPLAGVVNGSLWTLPLEAACYGFVLLLGLSGLLTRWAVLAVYAGTLVADKLWLGGFLVEYGTPFAAGAALYLWKPPMRAWIAALAAVLLLIAMASTGYRVAVATCGAYLVIYLAVAARPLRLPWLCDHDLSYGVYIYAFPVQQLVVQTVGGPWWLNVTVSLPIVLLLAWASWRWVEAPTLALLHRGLVSRKGVVDEANRHAV